MKTKCLINCTNEVIILGLTSLLSGQSDLECFEENYDLEIDLKGLVERYQPDVLVIDRQNRYYPYLFCRLASLQYPDLVVIVLEIDKNLIQVHRKGEITEQNNSDLLSVIRNRGSLIL